MQGLTPAIVGSLGSNIEVLNHSENIYSITTRKGRVVRISPAATNLRLLRTTHLCGLRYTSIRAQASVGDQEDMGSVEFKGKPSTSVLPYVSVACLGAILFGYHVGVVNGALEYLSLDLGISGDTVLQGWIVSTVLVGAFLGSFTNGTLADKFGRRKTFQLTAIPLTIGAYVCMKSRTVQEMMIGRFLSGIGIGISSALVPLYISEISPTEIRGALGSVNQLFICIGVLAALLAGLPLAKNPYWWRTMFGMAALPSVLLAIGMSFCPESPSWLLQQGRVSEAKKAITTLYGKDKVVQVMNGYRAAVQDSSTKQEASWLELFSSRYWKVVSIGSALFLFQQFAGINAIVYYSTTVFQSAGITSDIAASALVGASNVLGTGVASFLMDRQGRKSLLMISFSGMAASMLLLSLSFTWDILVPYSKTLSILGTVSDKVAYIRPPPLSCFKRERVRHWGNVVVVITRSEYSCDLSTSVLRFYCRYILSFSLGVGPVPHLLLPEIFPLRIRAKAVALSLGTHWATNFIIGLYFLSVVDKFGVGRVYLGFALASIVAVLYIGRNVVETKGRSLEEIEIDLSLAA